MSQQNGTFFVPSSSDVDIREPYRRSRISYTRESLLSLAKADNHSTVKFPQDVQLSISCVPVPDAKCQKNMPQKNSLKGPDDVNLLHRTSEPYQPPRRHKALPPSTRDSNDMLSGGTFGSSECTNKEKADGDRWRKDGENMSSPDVETQKELDLNSSTSSELSNFSSELCLPDEDSLITYAESFLMPEVDNSAVNDSYLSEADLLSPSSPCDMFEKLVEFILDDESSPDPYLDDPIPMIPHGAGLDGFCLCTSARQPYKQFCSNQLNPERVQQDYNSIKKIFTDQTMFSLFSDSYPLNRMYQPIPVSCSNEPMRKFNHEASQPMLQQKINPGKLHFCSQSVVPSQLLELKMAFCAQKLNSMQNFLGQEQGYGGFRRQSPDSHGNGGINQAVVDRYVDMKLRASHWHPFVRGL